MSQDDQKGMQAETCSPLFWSTYGGKSWINITNMEDGTDGSVATTTALGKRDESAIVVARDFGFNIPSSIGGYSVSITGVRVDIQSMASSSGIICTHYLSLTKDGGITWSESHADFDCDYPWGTSLGFHYGWGGSGQTWNFGLTPSQVNSSIFGVVFACENGLSSSSAIPSVDWIEVTVWYTSNGTTNSSGPRKPGIVEPC